MFFYVYVIIAGVDSNTASRCTEDILCQVLIPSFLSHSYGGKLTCNFIRSVCAKKILWF